MKERDACQFNGIASSLSLLAKSGSLATRNSKLDTHNSKLHSLMSDRKYLIFLLLLFLPSCITDEVVTTVFRPDGSFTRIVEFISDREDFDPADLATPLDSTWKIQVVRDTADTSRYRVRAEKEYAGVGLLNREYRTMPTTMKAVKREVSFEQKFVWFYTFYYYEETVYGILKGRPVHDYLTDAELRYLQSDGDELPSSLAGKDSAAVKAFDGQVQQHFRQWLGNSLYDLWYAAMREVVTAHPSERFTPARLLAAADTLRDLYLKVFQDLTPDETFSRSFRERFGIDLDTLMARYPEAFAGYTKITEAPLLLVAYENREVMPGKVFDSNAGRTEGEVLAWRVNAARFLPGDMDMFAASRKANYWAWLIALFVIIFAAVMFFPKKRR